MSRKRSAKPKEPKKQPDAVLPKKPFHGGDLGPERWEMTSGEGGEHSPYYRDPYDLGNEYERW